MADELRAAASLIVGRDGAGGLELLVMERSKGSRFLPGYVAFPGGAVTPGDVAFATEWFGTADQAARACAIRELAEETALVITADGLGPIGGWDPLSPVNVAPPSVDQLPEIAHWIAPEEVPVRFDARYFAADASDGLDPTPDGSEVAAAWWVAPRALLTEWESGDRLLYWPTYVTMLHLAACGSVHDVLGLRFETHEPTDDDLASLPSTIFEQR